MAVNNRKLLVFLSLTFVLLSIFFSTSCMRFRTSDKQTIKQFLKDSISVEIKRVIFDGYSLRYILRNNKASSVILFIHGAPGSGDAFYNYLKDSSLSAQADLITIDRPGYGYSNFGKAETSIQKQVNAVRAVIQHNNYDQVYLVGHSFGGPIALQYAIQYPDEINGVLMLAPAIDPNHEKIVSLAHLGRIRPTRWLTPASFKVATDEKFTHIQELQKLDSLDFHQISTPIIHIHGKKDMLVPFENLAYAETKIPSAFLKVITLAEENHFIPWTQQELVTQEILSLLQP